MLTGDDNAAEAWVVARIVAAQSLYRWPWLRSLWGDDVRSDALFGALDALGKYDPSKGKFGPYCRERCKGAVLDGLRRRDGLRTSHEGTTPKIPTQRLADDYYLADEHDDYAAAEAAIDVERFLNLLPPRLAAVLRYVDLEGHTQAELALLLGVTETRVCQLRRKGLDQLRRKA